MKIKKWILFWLVIILSWQVRLADSCLSEYRMDPYTGGPTNQYKKCEPSYRYMYRQFSSRSQVHAWIKNAPKSVDHFAFEAGDIIGQVGSGPVISCQDHQEVCFKSEGSL